jgi:hypothetical protein
LIEISPRTETAIIAGDRLTIHASAYSMAAGRNRRNIMARKSRFSNAAEKIGAAVGRADRTAHKLAKAGVVAKKELEDISKEVESLKRRLLKASKRLKKAMA